MSQLYVIHRKKHRGTAKMRRQRNMAQMNEQNKTAEKELNKMETSDLLEVEFQTLVIRMLSEHRGTVGEVRTSTAKHRAWKP